VGIYYNPTGKKWNVSYEKTDYVTNLKTDNPTNVTKRVSDGFERVCEGPWWRRRCSDVERFKDVDDTDTNNANRIINAENTKENAQNTVLNQQNTYKNQAYDTTVATAASTRGGDYTSQRQLLRNLGTIDDTLKSKLEDQFKTFYQNEKLQRWDVALGAKPQYGTFDPKYYKQQNPNVATAWQSAVANDDIDITERYGENGYYLQHYTSQGKPAGLRGNALEQTSAAQSYTERKPTDTDLQQVRDLQLGVDTTTQTQRLLNIPEIAAEWEKAKNGDPYWSKQAKEKYLNPVKPDEFASLFMLSDRP